MPKPNIVLLVADCLRVDQMGCYGVAASNTPAVDALAARGTVFEQAVAMGFHTPTTMTAVMSGCYPSTYGGFSYLSPERPQVPLILQAAGYHTAAFVPNPYLYPARGFGPGFDRYDECWPRVSRRGKDLLSLGVRAVNRFLRSLRIHVECPPYLAAAPLTEKAIRWLEPANEPFFLWLHYMDAHTPYGLDGCALLLPGGRGHRPYEPDFWWRLQHETGTLTAAERALAKERYAIGVRAIDAQIGRLHDWLAGQGSLRETFLVIMADHGEMFFEHGQFGHSNGLYEPIIHIPLIIVPLHESRPRRISAQVPEFDLAPTLVEMAGASPPAEMEAESFLAALHGEPIASRPAISQTIPRPGWRLSLRDFPWKFIWEVDPERLEGQHEELYHLADDPGESENLASRYPDRVAAMRRHLRHHAQRLDLRDLKGPDRAEDPELGERLRALGYLDAE